MTTTLTRRAARNPAGLPSIFATDPFSSLRDEFDSMLSAWFADKTQGVQSTYTPLLDLTENEADYLVHADLPGIQPNEIKVQVSDNVLTISGERKYEKAEGKEKKAGTPHFVERYHGTFSRSIVLPGAVKQDKIDARYHDGVLSVTLPKAQEQKPCQVPVKS